MRYVLEKDRDKVRTEGCGSIHVSGSVVGMQRKFGWKPGEQVRVGSWIHNVGAAEIARLRAEGLLRGEAR